MAIFNNLGEKVVVTRGHLLAWRAIATIFAGNSIVFAGMQFDSWLEAALILSGGFFDVIGLVMLLASHRHFSTKPKPHL